LPEMNSIQMQAIISPTRELTIKLPAEMSPGTGADYSRAN